MRNCCRNAEIRSPKIRLLDAGRSWKMTNFTLMTALLKMNTAHICCLVLACLQQAIVECRKVYGVQYIQTYATTNVKRGFVPMYKRKWTTAYSDYVPTELNMPCPSNMKCDPNIILSNEIAFNRIDENGVDRRSKGEKYSLNAQGLPLNPKGRTGISGRGLLPRWGPNFYVVLLVLRSEDSHQLLVKNTTEDSVFDMLGIPGEFVDAPKNIVIPPKLMGSMKTSLSAQGYGTEAIDQIMTRAVKRSRKIFSGFIGDERNTDNSWVEVVVNIIDDFGITDIGLVDPTASNEMAGYQWHELELSDLIKQLEQVVRRSKMTTMKALKYMLVQYKERFMRMTLGEKAGEVIPFLTLTIALISVFPTFIG